MKQPEITDLAKEARRVLLSLEDNTETLMSLEMFKEIDSYFYHPEEDEDE